MAEILPSAVTLHSFHAPIVSKRVHGAWLKWVCLFEIWYAFVCGFEQTLKGTPPFWGVRILQKDEPPKWLWHHDGFTKPHLQVAELRGNVSLRNSKQPEVTT